MLQDAVNAVLLQADWRPLLGLTEEDRGTLVERVIATAVMQRAVDQHNKAISKSK